MDDSKINPYIAPSAIRDRSAEPQTASTKFLFTGVLTATVAYHLFLLLLLSSPPDRFAACVFLLNTPLLLIWLYRLKNDRSDTANLGLTVVAGLVLIALILLVSGGHPEAIAVITGAMISVFVLLTFFCHRKGKLMSGT